MRLKSSILPAFIAICLIVAGGWWWHQTSHPHCHFPEQVRRQTTVLQLYCPDPDKLPGYVTSQEVSASFGDNAVIFSLLDSNGSTLAISEQNKPSAADLNRFVSGVIPLHFDVQTPVGLAKTGVSQNGSISSLPTNSKTWLIITGPANYSPDRLTQILKSFQAD